MQQIIKTEHQFIKLYPISADSEKLIIGTIHPHDYANFRLPYFYGNTLSIWNILNRAFLHEIGDPITVEGIISFLAKHKISISDTILECERIKNTALDKDLVPTKLNISLFDQIKHSSIKEIFFTSGFGKNNAFRLFYVDILKMQITPEIRQNREVVLDEKHFGRPIKLTILYSPSGSANIGISKSYIYKSNKDKYKNAVHPVDAFKIDYYRDKFNSHK